jgi:hypothetical protein
MRNSMILAFVAVALTAPASGETYVVRPDGGGDFPTIQAAIDAAEEGDVIELTDGVFRGDGNRDILWLEKAITVRSQSGDPSGCMIDCEGTPAERHQGIEFYATPAGASLEGVTIAAAYGGLGGGMIIDGCASPTIIRCVLWRNEATQGGGGMVCHPASNPTLIECTFVENTALYGGALCL